MRYVGWSSTQGFHWTDDGAYVTRADYDELKALLLRTRIVVEMAEELSRELLVPMPHTRDILREIDRLTSASCGATEHELSKDAASSSVSA